MECPGVCIRASKTLGIYDADGSNNASYHGVNLYIDADDTQFDLSNPNFAGT